MAKNTCERCGGMKSNPKNRYCTRCGKAVLDELKDAGYLRPVPPPGSATFRGADAREDTYTTKNG